MELLVVANPVAGAGRGAPASERLCEVLDRRGHRVECLRTAGPDQARRALASRSGDLSGLDRIVVVGGDGTLNEVLNGLPDPGRVPIAQLAVGTANMLARDLELPRRPEALAELLESGAIRHLDLGLANGRRFLMNASCGFDAEVTRAVRARRSGTLGFHAYLLPIRNALRRYREPELAVRLDEGEARPAALVIVSNLRNYGGLFSVTQDARCDSGHLDVCLCRRARVRDLLRYVAAGALRRFASLRGVSLEKATRVRVESAEPVAVQVDGDPFGTTPLDVALRPAAVPFVTCRGG